MHDENDERENKKKTKTVDKDGDYEKHPPTLELERKESNLKLN